MHIARQTSQELVVVSGTRWISAGCAAGALATGYLIAIKHEPKTYFFLPAFLLLFTAIMYLRKTFVFDATRRMVRWSGRKAFQSESGEIPFSDITDIGTETKIAVTQAGKRDVPAYRLTIITAKGEIPMAYAYSAVPDGFAPLRKQILDFIKSH